VRYGIHLPQLGRAAEPALLVEVARLAEQAGFEDAWVSDHVAVPAELEKMPAFFPEPVPLIAAAASHTSRIRFGTSVLIPAYRNPMHLAKQWATLDWLATGRTILGVGAGFLRPEFEICGVEFERRGERLDDYIAGWRVLWAGGTDHESRFFTFKGARLKPQPAHPIPIWIGGATPAALRRAAHCDGWHPTWAPVEEFGRRLDMLRAELDLAGRDPAEVTVSMHWEVVWGEAPPPTGYWSQAGDGFGERRVLAGRAVEMREAIAAYENLGLEHVVLTPQARSAGDWRETVSGLAELLNL
jgi:probable F420-dependent oxidoreductase